MIRNDRRPSDTGLRFGWTTGCCATAAACAAYWGLKRDGCPEDIDVVLPGGQTPRFAVAHRVRTDAGFTAGVVKDAGDDPDVTDGVLVLATLEPREADTPGLEFVAGEGVGTVTRAGLPLAVGEPAINPVPRQMLRDNLARLTEQDRTALNFRLTIAIPGGEALARQTWNPRLGIVGGLSVLGTSGIVRPFSCSAWIHAIHRGIDVARANQWPLLLASTGNVSEKAAQTILGLDDSVSLEMGDFVGATLKYLARHPVPNLVLAGGFAKMTKIAQGAGNLHNKHSTVDFDQLAKWAADCGAQPETCADIKAAPTALAAVNLYPPLAQPVARSAAWHAENALKGQVAVRAMVFARDGTLLADRPRP